MVSLNPREETSNTRLEPIVTRNQNNQSNCTLDSILKSPTENIKARLSSAEKRRDVDHQMSASLQKMNLKQEASSSDGDDEEDEKKRSIGNDEVLGEYYKEVVTSVNRCNNQIESHKTSLELAKDETDELMKKLKETDRISTQLKNTNFMADNADDLVQEILKEEYMFQRQSSRKPSAEEFLVKITDTNGNETRRESRVTLEEKRKLLETLRAIDNGEAVDVAITDAASRKSKLMRELFGDTHN